MKKQHIFIPAIVLAVLLLLIGCPSNKINIEYTPIADTSAVTYDKTILKVFIENSGSMDGYMCSGSEFKDAVKGYISLLKSDFDSLQLNYINSQIIARPNNLKSFITDLTPESFMKAGGNRSNTDMADLIEKVLLEANDSSVVLFVSDCILDLPDDPTKNFLLKSLDVTDAVKSYIKDKNNSIEIIQLQSAFKGVYFGVDGITYIDAERPYYIWVIGPNEKLAQLNADAPIDQLPHGVANRVSFSKEQTTIPFDITNAFGMKPQGLNAGQKGDYTIIVNANLGRLLQSEENLSNPANYHFQSSDAIKVDHVVRKNGDPTFTHAITITFDKTVKPSEKQMSFKNDPLLPAWVEKSNDDTGRNITSHLDQTTGIKYLIEGVAKAYEKESCSGSITFTIKKR